MHSATYGSLLYLIKTSFFVLLKVLNFDLYRRIHVIRTSSTQYRYADRPLPGGYRASPRAGMRRRFVFPCGNKARRCRLVSPREGEASPRSPAR
ncbi:hypothetical protein BHE74_00047407 [Ensete ventricosum]|nr:hypothetical protein BHE74_00047407 [Ensete ventricosum]